MNDRSPGSHWALVDRDGTINEERHYLGHPDELVLIPGSAEALRDLRGLGFGIVVVTNQAQIGRGHLTTETLGEIHGRLERLLDDEGAHVEAILHCPHAPEDGCDCRKPAPGMALRAAERFGFDLRDAVVIGDHAGDVGMGRAVGAETFLVLTGHGAEERAAAERDDLADHVVADLAAAVAIIAARDEGDDDG